MIFKVQPYTIFSRKIELEELKEKELEKVYNYYRENMNISSDCSD